MLSKISKKISLQILGVFTFTLIGALSLHKPVNAASYTYCSNGEFCLQKGDNGPIITNILINYLERLGYDLSRGETIFREKHENALKDFQRNNGLTVDGILGPTTLREMRRQILGLHELQSKPRSIFCPSGTIAIISGEITDFYFLLCAGNGKEYYLGQRKTTGESITVSYDSRDPKYHFRNGDYGYRFVGLDSGTGPIRLEVWHNSELLLTDPIINYSHQDFRLTRSVPLSSGNRKLFLADPLNLSQQIYLITPYGSGNFGLFEIEYLNFASVDVSEFIKAGGININQLPANLNNFKFVFRNNTLSEIILSDGTRAEFRGDQVIIFSSTGRILETLSLVLPRVTAGTSLTTSEGACQNTVNVFLSDLEGIMGQIAQILYNSNSSIGRELGIALSLGSGILDRGTSSIISQVKQSTCQAPLRCEQRREAGANEIRVDTFQAGSSRVVDLEVEFFEIPDKIEIFYEGERITNIGPTGDRHRRRLLLDGNTSEIGVTVTGNSSEDTRWWYELSCPSS